MRQFTLGTGVGIFHLFGQNGNPLLWLRDGGAAYAAPLFCVKGPNILAFEGLEAVGRLCPRLDRLALRLGKAEANRLLQLYPQLRRLRTLGQNDLRVLPRAFCKAFSTSLKS